jgi:hypothetical protein
MKFISRMNTPLLCCTAGLLAISQNFVVADKWDPLRDGLDAWKALDLDVRFAVDIGTVQGREFLYETDDGWTLNSRFLGASFSKWTTAVMIANMVSDGVLAFEDKASKYLDFWTTDPKDPRFNVTLASLLSLTSGVQTDASGVSRCEDYFSFDYLKCAEAAYNESTSWKEPRTLWTYLSAHHQFAGAMAVAASGKVIQRLLKEYLYTPFNMQHTEYFGGFYPVMAVAISSTGTDVENFLKGMLDYSGAKKEVLDQVEIDWTEPPVNLAPRGNYFGHYGMGHMWECFGYAVSNERIPLPLPEGCTESNIHSGPGESGNYPLIDRSTGGGEAGPVRPQHYWNLHISEEYEQSGTPEYLRIISKPVSDFILNGTDPSTINNTALLANGGGLLRRDIVYIKSELKNCTCTGAPTAKDEPYESLLEGLPADVPSKYRGEILKAGDGKSLMDVIEIQKKLGNCTCSGRQFR